MAELSCVHLLCAQAKRARTKRYVRKQTQKITQVATHISIAPTAYYAITHPPFRAAASVPHARSLQGVFVASSPPPAAGPRQRPVGTVGEPGGLGPRPLREQNRKSGGVIVDCSINSTSKDEGYTKCQVTHHSSGSDPTISKKCTWYLVPVYLNHSNPNPPPYSLHKHLNVPLCIVLRRTILIPTHKICKNEKVVFFFVAFTLQLNSYHSLIRDFTLSYPLDKPQDHGRRRPAPRPRCLPPLSSRIGFSALPLVSCFMHVVFFAEVCYLTLLRLRSSNFT